MSASPFEPDLSCWEAWQPAEVAGRLADVEVPWCVAGGWALDLHVDRQTRAHEDLEISVSRDDFAAVARALDGFELLAVGGGLAHVATEASLRRHHQTWVRERGTGLWRLDIFREPWERGTWVFRRDSRIRLPLSSAIERTPDGVPYARPEIVLLFKAKAAREKDEQDLDVTLPHLDRKRRSWLTDALRVAHPGHPWIERLRR